MKTPVRVTCWLAIATRIYAAKRRGVVINCLGDVEASTPESIRRGMYTYTLTVTCPRSESTRRVVCTGQSKRVDIPEKEIILLLSSASFPRPQRARRARHYSRRH
ncbi:hypothetical protein B0H14DRAFT_2691477 [Mycena olivaceomarginata]|nr:hypothetical protein B0H14DRAFT_2691477 [Mycena olivaceomarginata]